jgi:hypothetical protein
MKIWLDELTKKAGEIARSEMPKLGGGSRSLEYDFNVMQGIAARSALRDALNSPLVPADDDGFFSAVLPLFAPTDAFAVPPYACCLSSNLVQQFAGTTASNEVVRHAQEFIARRSVVYVDFADRALRIGNELHLKSLVISPGNVYARSAARSRHPGMEALPRFSFFASVGRIGEFANDKICWYSGGGASKNFISCSLIDQFGETPEFPFERFRSEIEHLAWLTMTYAAVAEPAARRILPQVDAGARSRKDRATRRNARGLSLFKIERLSEPADRFGSDAGGNAPAEWQLARRIGVRGHYKMQPYGPANGWRKLIFVKRHMRGPDSSPPLHTMSAL